MTQDQARDFLLKQSKALNNGIFPSLVTHQAKITNPLCGDHVELRLYLDTDLIKEIGFKAVGCALCLASSQTLCEILHGRATTYAHQTLGNFETAIAGMNEVSWPSKLEELTCFQFVRKNPSRKPCVLLPWVTFRRAFVYGVKTHPSE